MITTEGVVLGFVLAWMLYPMLLILGVYAFDDEPARSPFDTCNCNRHRKGERWP